MNEEIDVNILHELITDIAGKNAEPIADILRNKAEVNEYKIADKLQITVNQVRNILYKLFDKSIVAFRRKKDKQKGWYIYFWSLNIQKALIQFIKIKETEISNIKNQIVSLETKHYYSCPYGCVEVNEETALHYNFICQECGQLLVLADQSERIKGLKRAIEKFEKQMVVAQAELSEIEAKLLRKEERLKKKKALERKEKLAARRKERQKLLKKSKKPIKKVKKVTKKAKAKKKADKKFIKKMRTAAKKKTVKKKIVKKIKHKKKKI